MATCYFERTDKHRVRKRYILIIYNTIKVTKPITLIYMGFLLGPTHLCTIFFDIS